MTLAAPARIGQSPWEPPDHLSEDKLVSMSDAMLAEPDIETTRSEDIFTVEAAGLEWDIGAIVYQPTDASKIPRGPDGQQIGFFLTHGGNSDFRVLEQFGQLLAKKRGIKAVSMTFPGRFYFDDPNHDWPGDTFNADGTVRTPIWKRGEVISADQYELVSNTHQREMWGTRASARARPGTPFHARMAGWPLAFEAAMLDICRRHFPPSRFSIYAHGHSTGGPFSYMLLQRVENVAGIAGIENSPFGDIWRAVSGQGWKGPFTDLYIRTWRGIARTRGAEILKKRGPEAFVGLAGIMEDVLLDWDKAKAGPEFKAESILHVNETPALTAAAEATAARLKLGPAATRELVDRYLGYPLPLTGPGVKPIPPLLHIYCAYSKDHTREKYADVIVPRLAAIEPTPRIRTLEFGTGGHHYYKPQDRLPKGLAPCAIAVLYEAIMAGYYLN